MPGNDQTHLGAMPGGMTGDGTGNLLICDPDNNRVVVVGETDGKYKAEFKTDAPRWVGVSTVSGAIYVSSDTKAGAKLVRVNGWKDAKQVGEGLEIARSGWRSMAHSMAVDATASPAVIWISAGGEGQLIRVTDQDGKFERQELSKGLRAAGMTEECYLGLVVDRQTRELYYRNGNFGGIWERYSEASDKVEQLDIPQLKGGGGTGGELAPAPNGLLYGLRWPHAFMQFDRTGKPVPFAEPRKMLLEEGVSYNDRDRAMQPPGSAYIPVAMGELPHTLGVRWGDGHLFVLEPYIFANPGGRTSKAMHEYLPSGKRLTAVGQPIIWWLSDAAVGPKFDAAGNIYVAEVVRPKGWDMPPELKARIGANGVAASTYGSIVKFSPKGGMVHFGSGPGYDHGPVPFVGEPQLDPTLKTIDADYYNNSFKPVQVTGAEWIHPGIGHIGFYGCNCENTTFDVDEFGRTFFPDFCLFQIRVIDTAGNSIINFGGYGNPENCGSDSPVKDPKTGLIRPRLAKDPKSPFAEPEIAMAWPAGVVVTDKYAYIGDTINRRLLRAKLVYAAEETCEAK